MDKKKLIVTWAMGILLLSGCAKHRIIAQNNSNNMLTLNHGQTKQKAPGDYIIPICFSTLIIGGLLIYTSKDKKTSKNKKK